MLETNTELEPIIVTLQAYNNLRARHAQAVNQDSNEHANSHQETSLDSGGLDNISCRIIHARTRKLWTSSGTRRPTECCMKSA